MPIIDIVVFCLFVTAVLFVGMYKSKGEKTDGAKGAEEYFLAGRGLSWWLIGFSLIAANISAEQFVGMSGQGAGVEGISCASWEWIAAITLVVVAFALLPYFLKTGITTIPEFLEVRYNHWARTLMTVSMMGILIVASLIGVTYAGGLVMKQLFFDFGIELSMASCCWIIGGLAGIYVLFGGLKACAWADLLQGSALIVGGAVIAWFALDALGGAEVSALQGVGDMANKVITQDLGAIERFRILNAEKLIMGRPASDPAMPWTILLMGIWIPNFYYWGLNQYITQRILGSASLAEGQKGLVFAAGLKLLIPFIIVIPGIIAFNLFSKEMATGATEDFHNKVLVNVVDGTLDKNTLIVLTDKSLPNLTPEQIIKVQANNAPLLAKIGLADANEAAAKATKNEITLENGEKITLVSPSEYKYDSALGLLITKLIPKNKGILGFVIAALLGAIVSSLAAVLNATSTLFTMDIYSRYVNPNAAQGRLVLTGRICTVFLVAVGCIVAPLLRSESIFAYIQSVQCYVSPGVLAVFIFGLLNRRAGRSAGMIGLLVAPVVYGLMTVVLPAFGYFETLHYLHSASIAMCSALVAMFAYGCVCKLPQSVTFDSKTTMDLTSSKPALGWGLLVCVLTLLLYVIFW